MPAIIIFKICYLIFFLIIVGIANASYDAVNSHALVEIRHVFAGVRKAMKAILFMYAGCNQAVFATMKITGAGVSKGEIYPNNSVPASCST